MTTTPYADDREHLRDGLRRLDLLLIEYLAGWRAERGGAGDQFSGLYVSDAEVDRLLGVDRLRDAAEGDTTREAGEGREDGPDRDASRPFGTTDADDPAGGFAAGARAATEDSSHDHGESGRGGHQVDGRAASRTVADRSRSLGEEAAGRRRSLRELIAERERQTREVGRDLRLRHLVQAFDLDRRHVDALLAVAAPELDGRYEKVYAYLQDDLTRKRPTVELLCGILQRADEQSPSTGEERSSAAEAQSALTVRTLFARDSPLVRHRLVRFADNGPLPSSVAVADPRVVEYLLGSDAVASELAAVVARSDPDTDLDDLDVGKRRRDRLAALADRPADRPDAAPVLAAFDGPAGTGKADAVAALATAWDRPLLTVDAAVLATDEAALAADADSVAQGDAHDRVQLLVREARLQGAAIHLRGVDALAGDGNGSRAEANGSNADAGVASAADLDALLSRFDVFDGPVFLTGEEPLSPRHHAAVDRHEVTTLSFPRPGYERRRERWTAVEDLPEELNPAELAATFRLTSGQVADAVAAARALSDGKGLDAEAVYEGCRAQTREQLGSLARRLEPTYTWADIVLPDDAMTALREVAAHVRHRSTVFSTWGFAEKFSLGNGVNVLFAGPPGTGKTMAAEVVANDAGLDLYRVDLSNVVSKYIGETESNLGQLFDEAAASNAILFFDEADALFGERTEVRDSHDRYANVEVSYLLQRMEEHDGTTILASNMDENIDDAFRRRINRTVEFPFPDRELRADIWRSVFPEAVPVGDVDIEFLSSFDLAGGNIKNAALTAAFLAADDGGTVEMAHLVRAVDRERAKLGQLVSPDDFGEYHDLLR